MVTVAQPLPAVNDRWHVEAPAIVVVAPIAPDVPAFSMGFLDAQEGMPFAPEQYFVWWNDLLEYTEGFESVNGESDITRDFKAQFAAITEPDEDRYDIGEHESRFPFLY